MEEAFSHTVSPSTFRHRFRTKKKHTACMTMVAIQEPG